MATDFQGLLAALTDHKVDFVVIGGVALIVQGSARTTTDLDICYSRQPDNVRRLADALAALRPTLRGAPPDLPFRWDARTLANGLNFTLESDLGWIDLLGEVTGLGSYDAVSAAASPLELYGKRVLVLGLDGLERAKTAAGRVKDLTDLAEIREIRRRTGHRSGGA
jgi:hypothetical protein